MGTLYTQLKTQIQNVNAEDIGKYNAAIQTLNGISKKISETKNAMVVGDGKTLTSSSKTELNNMIKNKIKELIDKLFTSIEIQIFITDKDKRVVAEHLNVCSLDIIKNANIVYFDLETSNNMKTLGTYKKFEYKHPRNNDDIFDYILHFSDGDKKYYEYYKNGIGTKVFCEKNTDISRIDKNVYDLYKKYYDLLPKNNNNSETRITVPSEILDYNGDDELLKKLKDTDYSVSEDELLKLRKAEAILNLFEKKMAENANALLVKQDVLPRNQRKRARTENIFYTHSGIRLLIGLIQQYFCI